MHLIYVTAAAPFSFGEAFIAPEILELQRRRHRVTVVPLRPRRTIHHGDVESFRPSTIRQPLASWPICREGSRELLRAPRQAWRAAQLVARSRTLNILAKNAAVVPKALWLARTAGRTGAEHIHAHWAGTTATTALIASVVSGIPWSFTAHRWDITENNLLEEKAAEARFVRAIDRQGARELAPLLGAHRDKLRVIQMGVEVSELRPPVLQQEAPVLRVVIGAHLFEKKGHMYAIDAVRALAASGTRVVVDCVGHGPLRSQLERQVAATRVQEFVRFTGLLSHPEFLARLRSGAWDVALLPSVSTTTEKEGLPVFLIEAMAAGVPVVASATGGIPELLDGGAGLLVAERDAEAIAAVLKQLDGDRDLRRRLAEAGRRRVVERFQIQAKVSELLAEMG
jgi:glycosyltransferase involved in cell wall biosynthesis